MPLDPTISLQGKVAAPAGGLDASNLGGLATALNSFNQNRLFQQSFAARQRAGELIAKSDPNDPESGFKAMLADPLVAGYYPEALSAYRQVQQAQTAIEGAQQTQAMEGMAGIIKGLPAVLANPSMWDGVIKANMATLSPAARARVIPGVESLRRSLTDGLPTDPALARSAFSNRLTGILYPTVPPDTIKAILGTPQQVDIGGGIQPGLTAPPQGMLDLTGRMVPGGSFLLSGPMLGKSLSPQLPSLGGVPIPVGGVHGTGQAGPAAASGGPTPSLVNTEFNPMPAGTPLYDPARDGSSPISGRGIANAPYQVGGLADQTKRLAEDFTGVGKTQFDNQNTALSQLRYMSSGYDTMAKGGGFLVPGTGAEFRQGFGKAVNTLSAIVNPGKPPPFDADKITSAEDFIKQTNLLGTSVLTTMLGNQREAAQTIHKFTQSVPGISNTYLGGKLLVDTYAAAAERGIDQRNFENSWLSDPRNGGSLIGADEAFNKQYPATAYAEKVLAKHGLNEKGFTSFGALENAVRNGLLPPDKAAEIAKQQKLRPAATSPAPAAPNPATGLGPMLPAPAGP